MPSRFFQCKQFFIQQDACAMKVSTDAFILGALANFAEGETKLLDIGCGTALLSLMLAQRYPQAQIDAVEIDEAAAKQAAENVAQSPFYKQIKVHQADIKLWKSTRHFYDGIICNPPFFTNQLKSESDTRKLARHDDALTKEQLLEVIEWHLSEAGSAYVLMPSSEKERWEGKTNESSLWIVAQTFIFPNELKPAHVILYKMQHQASSNGSIETKRFTTHHPDRTYTEEAKNLFAPYYLFL